MLSRDEIDKLWIPFIVFENTEDSEATVGEDETEVTVTREGSYTESSEDVTEEINIFEGSQNRVTFQQLYSKEFKCEYQLQLYPFDTQVGRGNPQRGYWEVMFCLARGVQSTWSYGSWREALFTSYLRTS